MLSALILENFKAFGRRQFIPLAPITLIFGANSAGKSSVLQSLLLLKQTLAQAEGNETILLPKGDLVNLGSFREMVFAHEVDRVCEIAPLLAPQALGDRWFTGILRPYGVKPPLLPVGAGFRFGWDVSKQALRAGSVPYYWGRVDDPAYRLEPAEAPELGERAFQRTRHERPRSTYGGYTSYTRFARLGDLTAGHDLWAELYDEYVRQLHQQHVEGLRQLLDALTKAEKENLSTRAMAHLPLFWEQGKVDPSAMRERVRSTRVSIRDRLTRLADYTLDRFVEDIRSSSAHRTIALRNFLPDDVSIGRVQANELEYAFHQWLSPDDARVADPMPDVVRLSLFLASALRRMFDSMVYLGPLRVYPERHYIFSGNVAREVGKSGRLLPDLLFKQPRLVEETNAMLKAFKIGYTLRIHRVEDPNVEDVFGLRLVDDQSGTTVSMLDVGFGISQVLPVIVQSMLSLRNVILIEQPEIHLHPRLQADLGSLFAQCISAPRRNQFIVETHSEHLILRLQRLIREKKLKNSDVSVIYAMKGEDGSQCYPLRLDEEGDFIDEWPEGFFEEGYREMFG